MPLSNKDKLRSSVIDELIDAKNWFAVVPCDNSVKMFSCTDHETIKKGLVTIMLQDNHCASLFVEVVDEYVKIKCRKDLERHSSLN